MTSTSPTQGETHVAPQADHGDPARTLIGRIAEGRAWLFLAGLIICFEVWSRLSFGATFVLNPFNVQSIAIFAVAPLLLATGQTFVIISGGIDLSLGFIMGLAAVIAAHATNMAGAAIPLPLAMLAGILAAVLVAGVPGVINGLLISRLRIPPFIGTLGMFGVARGAAFLLAGGTTVPVQNSWFALLGNGKLYGVPYLVMITAVFVIVMHYLLSQTRFGQHNYAIGANVQAARRAGIDIRGHILRLYMLSAMCAGLGREPMRKAFGFLPVLDRKAMAVAAKQTMGRLDFHVSRLEAPVSNFSGGQRQAVAIGRAVYWDAQILIMDEPTAALGVPEQRKVISLIHQLKAQGRGVIFISHNLQDIFAVSDRIVVLRRGVQAGERKISETNHDEVVKLMVGG